MYLVLEDVVKIFPARGGSGEVMAVDHVSLEIEEGQLVTLLGPSGCGKTTTLRLIAGFEFPTQGTIRLDGEVINQEPFHQQARIMLDSANVLLSREIDDRQKGEYTTTMIIYDHDHHRYF